MLGALQAGIDEASQDAGVRAVVIAARGTAFCAGHDLKELSARRSDADGGRAYYALIMRLCADLMRAIVRCPKPVIAAVQGTATAAGCQLVASCDLAVAAEQASFATPGVNIGLFCSTPMVALSRNVPRKRAMEMLLLGEMLPAHAAAQYGLVNRVVPTAKVMDEALAMARLVASKHADHACRRQGGVLYRQIEMPLAEAYDYASGIIGHQYDARGGEGGDRGLHRQAPARLGQELSASRPAAARRMDHVGYTDAYIAGIPRRCQDHCMVGASATATVPATSP
jgi:enoyl-CoA hydratase/carnithine racemase